jgi:hypothetical protein
MDRNRIWHENKLCITLLFFYIGKLSTCDSQYGPGEVQGSAEGSSCGNLSYKQYTTMTMTNYWILILTWFFLGIQTSTWGQGRKSKTGWMCQNCETYWIRKGDWSKFMEMNWSGWIRQGVDYLFYWFRLTTIYRVLRILWIWLQSVSYHCPWKKKIGKFDVLLFILILENRRWRFLWWTTYQWRNKRNRWTFCQTYGTTIQGSKETS